MGGGDAGDLCCHLTTDLRTNTATGTDRHPAITQTLLLGQ